MSQRKPLFIQISFLLALAPFVAQAYEYGPDPRRTGAPGDVSTCVSSGCHSGTVNTGPTGSGVKIILSNGATSYVPGQTMAISVQITDSTKVKFGFEMTARLASNLANGQAGDFNPTDTLTQVICDDGSIKKTGSPCTQFPVEFIEHNDAGYEASTPKSYTFNFSWTPPASASAGNVVLYVAANAGPGDPPVQTPTNVYTSSVTLTPATTPIVTGITNGASNQSTIGANTYVQIYGQNLSTSSGLGWGAAFTTNSNGTSSMPTSLAGTSVTLGGTPAYVEYVSPGQVNVVTPNVVGNNIPVIVTVNNTASAAFSVTMLPQAAAFFEWCPPTTDCDKYLIAQHSADYSNVGKVNLFPSLPANFTTPAAPGETILLYGTGFGPTSPQIAAGIQTDKVYYLTPTPTATLGSSPATVVFGGLVPPFSQVYQFNITIPANMPAGDWPLVVTANGATSYSGMITVN
jgi:uncharacterized protein (TIGR03437 family)